MSGLQGYLLRILFERADKRQQILFCFASRVSRNWFLQGLVLRISLNQSRLCADFDALMAQPHCNHDDVHSTLRQMTRIHPWRIKRRGLNNVHSALFSMPTAKLTGEECQENAE